MHERFTDRARKVMQLAEKAARRQRHEYLGTEHILWALAQEAGGVAGHVLKSMGANAEAIRCESEILTGAGKERVALRQLPLTPQASHVITAALEACRRLSHNYVGTEHILLAIAANEETVAAQVLARLGLDLERVRQEVLDLLGLSDDPPQSDTKG